MRRASVPLPAAAGPSMAMTGPRVTPATALRRRRSSVREARKAGVDERRLVHRHRLLGRQPQAPARPWRCDDPCRSRPVPPPGSARPSPCTIRSSPSISTRAPFTASSAAVASTAGRSPSPAAPSARACAWFPTACEAITARTGYSSIIVGARSHGTSTPRSAP